jgi:DNA-binding ferritin-like protein (Dps family)
MSILLSSEEKLDLKRLLNENECVDNTENIRKVKHSSKIRDDVHQFGYLKERFFGENVNLKTISIEDAKKEQVEFENLVQLNCSFLFTVYPEIYKKMIKDELDLNIMIRLVEVLKLIEDSKTDQHEASVIFGRILKELYIDSAIKYGNHLDNEYKKEPVVEKNISWNEYKKKCI